MPPQASLLTFFSLPAHKQHGTAVASQFVSPRLGCLQSSSLLSSRSILCFWTLSFFPFSLSARRRLCFLLASPGLNNLDAAVPLVPVPAETPSIDKAVTLPPTTSRQKRPQETKHRSSPTPKKEVILWHLFFLLQRFSASIIAIVAGGTEARYLSTSTDFSPLTPAVCTACQDLLQCGEFPSSHQSKPPFFGSPAQSPADSEEKTLRFN